MANETEYANLLGPTDVLADRMAAALVQSVVVLPLIYKENVPADTAIKRWGQDGSLVAENISESATYSFSASSELTQTEVSATAVKTVVVSKLTVEAIRFKNMNPGKMADKQGQAIGRDLDDDILALFSGFASAVTAQATSTPEAWLDALTAIQGSQAGRVGGNLTGVLDHTGANQLRKYVIQSGAANFSQPSEISLLAGFQDARGYVGSLPGIDLYQTDGVPTSGGNDINLLFNPEMAFGGMYDPSINTEIVWVGSGGMFWEISSYLFNKVVEWVDLAGCKVPSTT